MAEYAFTEQELDDLKEVFFTEADEILQSLNQETFNLESGHDRENAFKNIQRHLHTLKGNSRALGFTCVSTVSHQSEDLLKAIQDSGREPDQALIDILFAINDVLQLHMDGYKSQKDVKLDDRLIERINAYISESGNGGGAGHAASRPEAARMEAKNEAAQTFRVESQRVDKILNLVGELVIGRSMVGQALTELGDRYKKDELFKRLGDANAFMEKTLSQLQKNVMKIRMLPIFQVFRKFPRVVRDLSVEKGKHIQLVMQGEKTELDKNLLDVIGEPLIHLVRNAIDHGIELPDVRERIGKPATGSLTLKASHEGNQIVIEITDDGMGLDPARFRQKAVEKGIKTHEEAERLSDEEALDLIFLSGFSTAEVVTDISGRGLGMDIVRAAVESLKGRIQVHSTLGEGTTFTLRLPLTLAIIRAMLFWIGDRLFALPMSSIERIARVKEGDHQTVTGSNVLRFRDKVISLISLKDSLMINGTAPGQGKSKFVIVVGLADKLYGFLVDRLAGQQELVIKALDDHWGTVNCASGASILGSGKVVLILDAPALILKEIRREAGKG